MTQAIAWFAEVGKDDIGVAGGKGANLGEMTRARIPVPPGFIVTADTYRRFLEASGLRPPSRTSSPPWTMTIAPNSRGSPGRSRTAS